MASSAANTSASKRRLLLLAAAVVLLASPASACRRRPVRLRVYMHDIVGGPGQTAVRLVKGTGPENPSMHPGNHFGDTVAVDDLLTEGLAAGSAPMGRAQGTYMTGSMRRPVFVVSVTLMLAAGPYNGSTIVVAGHDDTSQPVRELAVVGGTGKLRRAAGHVLWSTAKVVSPLYAVLEPGARPPSASSRCLLLRLRAQPRRGGRVHDVFILALQHLCRHRRRRHLPRPQLLEQALAVRIRRLRRRGQIRGGVSHCPRLLLPLLPLRDGQVVPLLPPPPRPWGSSPRSARSPPTSSRCLLHAVAPQRNGKRERE